VRVAFTSARGESISAAFEGAPVRCDSDRELHEGGDRDAQGAVASIAWKDEHSPRGSIDSPGGSRVVKRASPWPRSASAGPEPSGARALEESESPFERAVHGSTPRRTSTRREPRYEEGAATRVEASSRQEHTRHGCSRVDWFGVQYVGRSASSIATPGSVNSAFGHARSSSNGDRPHDDACGVNAKTSERVRGSRAHRLPMAMLRGSNRTRASRVGVEADSVRVPRLGKSMDCERGRSRHDVRVPGCVDRPFLNRRDEVALLARESKLEGRRKAIGRSGRGGSRTASPRARERRRHSEIGSNAKALPARVSPYGAIPRGGSAPAARSSEVRSGRRRRRRREPTSSSVVASREARNHGVHRGSNRSKRAERGDALSG